MLSPAGHIREYSCALSIRRDSTPEVGHKRMPECHAWCRRGAACRDRTLEHFTIPLRRSPARVAPLRAGRRPGAKMRRNGEAGFGRRLPGKRSVVIAALAAASVLFSQAALADEGGVSLWLPGFFGSLAAAPQQPGWSLTSIYYHTSVSAGADVTRAREFETGRISLTATASVSANVNAKADLGLVMPTYTFATPVFGGQLTVGAIGIYGGVSTSLAGSVTGALATPLGTLPFSRFDTINDSVTGFGDVLPIATLRWNNGVHNYMTYITGDIPVGVYDSTRLSNIGIGHGTIDAGAGYTYLNPQTGHEFSGVLGFTYNFTNQSTQYQNGVDMHFDWGASQFLTKQFLVGAVGYVYQEVGCDSGSGDRVGCFQSQVVGVGPQLGVIIPLSTTTQGYLNLKSYWEFAHDNRPDGWNAWVTFVISPAEQTPSTAPRRMLTK